MYINIPTPKCLTILMRSQHTLKCYLVITFNWLEILNFNFIHKCINIHRVQKLQKLSKNNIHHICTGWQFNICQNCILMTMYGKSIEFSFLSLHYGKTIEFWILEKKIIFKHFLNNLKLFFCNYDFCIFPELWYIT